MTACVSKFYVFSPCLCWLLEIAAYMSGPRGIIDSNCVIQKLKFGQIESCHYIEFARLEANPVQ